MYYVSCRAVINGLNLQHLLWLSMPDFLMLRMKLPVADRIHTQSNKSFATGAENEATCDQKLMTAESCTPTYLESK